MVISVGAFLLIAGEFGARMAGLGNPPIYVMDADIEYYLAPNSQVGGARRRVFRIRRQRDLRHAS